MEETIGECTNLHITYPAMVVGYFVLLRANRTVEDALDAPELDAEEEVITNQNEPDLEIEETAPAKAALIERNDIAVRSSGLPVEEILRFYAALSEMTGRRGIRDEISRYESIGLALIEPQGQEAGEVFAGFPPPDSPLHPDRFFSSLYQQYDERFVFGAPLLASRTRRREWSSSSIVFAPREGEFADWPSMDYSPRILG